MSAAGYKAENYYQPPATLHKKFLATFFGKILRLYGGSLGHQLSNSACYCHRN
jgi:hypothetical protein